VQVRRSVAIVVATAAILLAAPVVTGGGPTSSAAPTPKRLVLGAEDNRLIAYDPATGRSAVALGSNADDPAHGLDLNGQICADPQHPGWFIAGEDTNQTDGNAADAPGWGYLHLTGTSLDDLDVTMSANLIPTYVTQQDNPENYGCGFLSDGRLVTTDVGDQQPQSPATGQLIVWFPGSGGGFTGTHVPYCKVDVGIPTAGGVYVDPQDRVLLASNRPGTSGTDVSLGGIYRYDHLPTSMAACHRTDATGAPLVDAGVVTKSTFILGDPVGALTPSAVIAAPGGGYFVSSVLTGVIAQYDADGHFVRRVLEAPLLNVLPTYPGGTPYGMVIDDEGSLWYADIGVQITLPAPGPVDHTGSVRRIRFVDGLPQAPETMRTGMSFPDGMGFVPLAAAPSSTPTAPRASSEWGCGDWGMYGGNLARTFSTECPTAIEPATARTLAPAWTTQMPRTVTASPVVVGGTVYVGDWGGTMHALRLSDGAERWRYQTAAAPGAYFGPIVSSAAVADVGTAAAPRRLVIFGSGARLYAVDAATGSPAWVLDRTAGLAATPVEIESSPVVYGGLVYVGVDTHGHAAADTGGVRGGLLAVDAATGALLREFNPEQGQAGQGCGSVWSSPTIDTVEGTVLVATGNCDAAPSEFTWTRYTESVTALDLHDGHVRWSFQPHPPNQLDHDFGATPNIITLPGSGRRLVGVGSKDASYYAIEPHTGARVWSTQVAIPGDIDSGFSIGGFIGSSATWRGNVYGSTAIGGPPWYHSLNGANGARRWSAVAGPSYAGSAVVNGVVFAGDLTAVFKAFDARNGLPLFAFPVLGPISSAPAIAGDTIVVGTGTSSSDLCAKDTPIDAPCHAAFDATLGGLGSVTAFRPLTVGRLLHL
jgi:polyvinyl alcohol dehydrogenase (cytochrome)